MKAIICTQCGARIENVSETSLIVDCDYCGARILLDAAKPVKRTPIPAPSFDPPASNAPPLGLILFIVALIVIGPVIIGVVVLVSERGKSTPERAYSAPATPYTYSTPSSWSVSTDVPQKPIPQVNYQPRISWDGPNDLQHFEDPEVDISTVRDLTSEEVKKTVFKNRVVKLRVVINTEGEIDEVQTISGHPILVSAATESAKRSLFSARAKPTRRILTYTFRVLSD